MIEILFASALVNGVCDFGESAEYNSAYEFVLQLSTPESDSTSFYDDQLIRLFNCDHDLFDICIQGPFPFFFSAEDGTYDANIGGINYRVKISLHSQIEVTGEFDFAIIEIESNDRYYLYNYDRYDGILDIIEQTRSNNRILFMRTFTIKRGNYLGCLEAE